MHLVDANGVYHHYLLIIIIVLDLIDVPLVNISFEATVEDACEVRQYLFFFSSIFKF